MPGGRLQTNASIQEPVPGSILVQVRNPLQTIYIQKIVYSPTSIIPGTVLSFIDSLTLQSIGFITIMPPSVAQPPYIIDFGAGDSGSSGTALTKGASLVLAVLVGGSAGRIHIKAYQLPLVINVAYVPPATAGSKGP